MRRLAGVIVVLGAIYIAFASGLISVVTSGLPGIGQGDTQGYSFPVGLSRSLVSNGAAWPCVKSCHHDGTPAFDLAHQDTVASGKDPKDDPKTVGLPVYAIHAGRIQSVAIYDGIDGCYQIQLEGSDGWHYWYGHIANPVVGGGQTVTAGQQIAQIGQRACTGNGSYPHLHIDRGSPKGQNGGRECCRDPEFIKLMNGLWAKQP